MLFNSYSFIGLFLPVTFIVFFIVGARRHLYGAAWLTLASLFFYGWWNPVYVTLLLVSIAVNYCVGLLIAGSGQPAWMPGKKALLVIGITADLLLLGYYKYANFFLATVDHLAGAHWSLGEIILPLGISFFTFTQIAFLVDTYQGKVKEYNFVHYALFVTYFPHLIAGPVLHHKEMMPQFADAETYRPDYDAIAVGLTFFAIGLFKKAVLGDGIAIFERWGLGRPVALRTGRLMVDRTVYQAMELAGIRVGSNVGLAVYRPADPALHFYSGIHQVGSVIEACITTYIDLALGNRSHYRTLTITGSSWNEMRTLLLRAHASKVESIAILTHPFEYVKYKRLDFSGLLPNRINQQRLRRLCEFLRDHADCFEVATMGELAAASRTASNADNVILKVPMLRAVERMVENSLNDRISAL